MKKISFLVMLFIGIATVAFCQKSPMNQTYIDKNEKTHLIGQCDRTAFQQENYKEWFDKNYNDYEVDYELLKKVKRKTKGVTIEVFMATWCGDSRREVPRFFKVIDALKIKDAAVEIINVNNGKDTYKQSPTHEEKGKLIHRVPTFILYKNGTEIGRIVESPVTSIEMDLVQILLGLPSSPNYKIVKELDELLDSKAIPTEQKALVEYARTVVGSSKSSKEINTYGYVLLRRGETDKAITAFTINAMIYRKEPNVFDSLGEAYEQKGDAEAALNMYQKVLEIDAKHEHALERIAVLEKE